MPTRPLRQFVPAYDLTRLDIEKALSHARDVGREAFLEELGARAADRYVIVHDGFEIDAKPVIQYAWNLRNPHGRLAANEFRGDRHSIAEPLRLLGFWVEDTRAAPELDDPLGADSQRYVDFAKELPESLDAVVIARVRREQRVLRGALGLRPDGASTCWICGRTLPDQMLIAAHIKPRNECTTEEKRDVPSIAMVACLLGCDALYEKGHITVVNGKVHANLNDDTPDDLASAVREVEGRLVAKWGANNEQYFRWHHINKTDQDDGTP